MPTNKDEQHETVSGDEATGGEVDEPVEYLDRRAGRHEERDAGDETNYRNAVDGNAGLGAFEQEPGCLSIYHRGY